MSDPNAFGHWKLIHWLFDCMLNPILVQTLQWVFSSHNARYQNKFEDSLYHSFVKSKFNLMMRGN